MKKLKRLSLTDEVNRDAKQIQEEISSRKDLEDIRVSESMEASLFKKIQEYEFEKKQRTVLYRKKKRFLFLSLAAVFILVCGSVMTGTGSKSYLKVLWDDVDGDERSAGIDVEDMDARETEDVDELSVYREINENFGIKGVILGYKPENMFLESYVIDTEQGKAYLLYVYNEEVIRYTIYLNDADSSLGQRELDKLTSEYQIETDNGTVVYVEEYELDSSEKRYIGEFEYLGVHYQLKGVMIQEKFDEILKNLIFL